MTNIFSKFSLHGLGGCKLMLAGATVATTAIVGTAGVAAAHPWHHWQWHHNNGNAQAVKFCKLHYKDLGFNTQADCVKAFNHGHGHGYGYGKDPHHKHHHHHHDDGNKHHEHDED
ncbi:MAG TPA: hypothetical protein VLG47_07685 [Candidatus Saccharimonadales bacterium]|nr:hypothetical protein [Candidatus Saccharimonadales bacterium]